MDWSPAAHTSRLVGWLLTILRACVSLSRLPLFRSAPLHRRQLQVIRSVDKVGIAAASRRRDTVAFVDGAVLPGGRCGLCVYYSSGHALNAHGSVVRPEGIAADSNLTELAAVYWALLHHPCHLALSIYSDSAHALRCVEVIADEEAKQSMSSRARRRKTADAVGVTAAITDDRWRSLVWMIHALLRLRRAPTRFCKVKGHTGSRKNETADALAKKGAEEGPVLPVPIRISTFEMYRVLVSYLLCQEGGESAVEGAARRMETRTDRYVKRRPQPLSRDTSITQYLAIDCEMVGVGPRGARSVLASVSVVNEAANQAK